MSDKSHEDCQNQAYEESDRNDHDQWFSSIVNVLNVFFIFTQFYQATDDLLGTVGGGKTDSAHDGSGLVDVKWLRVFFRFGGVSSWLSGVG